MNRKPMIVTLVVTSVLICVFNIIVIYFFTRREDYYSLDVVWYSDAPELVFSSKAYDFEEYLVINDKKYNIYLKYYKDKIVICDKDTYPYEENTLWECAVNYNRKKKKLVLTVVVDNISSHAGEQIQMNSRKLKENEKMPSDASVVCVYKNAIKLLERLKIPKAILDVFKDYEKCVLDGNEIFLSDIEDVLWSEYAELDIDNDGKYELIYKINNISDNNCRLMVFYEDSQGKVQLTELINGENIILYKDNVIEVLSKKDHYYQIEKKDDRICLNLYSYTAEKDRIDMYFTGEF